MLIEKFHYRCILLGFSGLGSKTEDHSDQRAAFLKAVETFWVRKAI